MRTKDVQLATEVVQDLKDLEGVRARPAREASAQDQGDRSVGVRTLWQHRIARSLFFEAGGRLLVVATIFQKKEREITSAVKKRAVERMERWRKERGV